MDIGSELSCLGLEESRNSCAHLAAIIRSARETVSCLDQPVLDFLGGFTPVAVWRFDSELWQATRSFAIDARGNMMSIGCVGSSLSVLYRKFGSGETGGHCLTSLEQEVRLFDRMASFIERRAPEDVGSLRVIRLWNGRIYDSMQMMAKVRLMADRGMIDFDELSVEELKPLLLEHDAAGRHGGKVRYRTVDEAALEPDVAFVKSLHLPAEEWDVFHREMKAMAREIAGPSAGEENVFCLYVSYDLEKRQCVNQVGELRKLLEYCIGKYGAVRLLVNGLTGREKAGDAVSAQFYPDVRATEARFTTDLTAGFGQVQVVNMFGLTLREKFAEVKRCHFYVAPIGNASLIPSLLDIPGVIYGANEAMTKGTFIAGISERSRLFSQEDVVSTAEDLALRKVNFGHDDGTRTSYRLRDGSLLATCAVLLSDIGAAAQSFR